MSSAPATSTRLDAFFTPRQRFGRLAGIVLVIVIGLGPLPLGFRVIFGEAAIGFALAGLVFVLISPVLLWAVLHLVRCGAWLDGNTLVVRSTILTRRCDLATAQQLALDSVPGPLLSNLSIPRLVTKDGATGRWVRLPLRAVTGELLPPDQLRALAAAIRARVRPPSNGDDAGRVARALTELADNPLARIL
jgi:hypothetical protein